MAMSRNSKHIRNIGIIAHIDAGKTTVTERMLFYQRREAPRGRGRQGHDDDRRRSRGAGARHHDLLRLRARSPGRTSSINLIDTPGHVDFTAEVERSLRVLDGGVVVFSAREGVEAQSETVWRQADKYHVPRIAFINKLDREGADFEAVFEEIAIAAARPTRSRLQIPVGQGPPHVAKPFRGVIDLVEDEAAHVPRGQGRQRDRSRARFPPTWPTRPSCGASGCSNRSTTSATS